MLFKELNLRKAYSSDEDDVLSEFYIPVLSNAIEYNRLAGFFSSTILAVAAKGILEFIENQGKMNLLISPRLREEEIQKNIKLNAHGQLAGAFTGRLELATQSKRNIEAQVELLDKLRRCPNCKSHNYTETINIYEKK